MIAFSRFGIVAREHSQIVITFHPSRRSRARLRLSLALFESNFSRQKALFFPGILPFWHEWPCQ